jgi:hypothetical protein
MNIRKCSELVRWNKEMGMRDGSVPKSHEAGLVRVFSTHE